jgi:hypothetical protein
MRKLLLITALCSISATAFADETVKWRHVQYVAAIQSQEVGDVKGHIISVCRVPGIPLCPDNSTSFDPGNRYSDLTNGSRALNGSLWLKYSELTKAQGTKFPRPGTATIVGGKGRYERAKGEGTFEGDQARGPEVISHRQRDYHQKWQFKVSSLARWLGSSSYYLAFMEIKMKRLLITAALCSVSVAALADETLKVRAITHVVSAQALDVGDVDGHTMSVARGSGLASFSDGSVGTASFVTVTDYVKGSGEIVRVYQSITAADGSQIWIKSAGSATVVGNKTEIKGAPAVIRFAGAKGDATWSGERLQAQLAAGAELYNDMVINIKK